MFGTLLLLLLHNSYRTLCVADTSVERTTAKENRIGNAMRPDLRHVVGRYALSPYMKMYRWCLSVLDLMYIRRANA